MYREGTNKNKKRKTCKRKNSEELGNETTIETSKDIVTKLLEMGDHQIQVLTSLKWNLVRR